MKQAHVWRRNQWGSRACSGELGHAMGYPPSRRPVGLRSPDQQSRVGLYYSIIIGPGTIVRVFRRGVDWEVGEANFTNQRSKENFSNQIRLWVELDKQFQGMREKRAEDLIAYTEVNGRVTKEEVSTSVCCHRRRGINHRMGAVAGGEGIDQLVLS
ncbi:hypothetical protein L1887_28336 [Cichorium endivia]|nr:hypothetical protein L1887_28336 [Cichorium endivia]